MQIKKDSLLDIKLLLIILPAENADHNFLQLQTMWNFLEALNLSFHILFMKIYLLQPSRDVR